MDAWLTRMYEEDGRRYLWAAMIVAFVTSAVVVGPVATALVAGYEGGSVSDWAITVGVSEAVAALIVASVWINLGPDFRVLLEWSGARGAGSAELAEAATAVAFTFSRRLATFSLVVTVVLLLPVSATTILISTGNTTLLDFTEVLGGGVTLLAMAAVAVYGMAELFLRPVRRSLAIRTGVETNSSLVANLVLGALALVVAAGNVAVSLTARRATDGAGALGEGLLVTFLITAVYAAVFWPLLSGTVLAPIQDLIRGVRDVARGRTETTVAVTSDDEIGELAISFNTMVDGLRERESLREHNVELVEELQASRARIVAAADESRRRVERDLHDGAQQRLVLLNLKLGVLERRLEADPEAAVLAAELRNELETALEELRDLAHGIYPQVLTSDGLGGALAEAAEQAGVPVSLSTDGTGRYSPELEAAVYFCCLEALQNVAKHAGGQARAQLSLVQSNGELLFEVIDDGAGFDADDTVGSAGLRNMADRIGALGGTMRVESTLGRGTRVVGAVPVER